MNYFGVKTKSEEYKKNEIRAIVVKILKNAKPLRQRDFAQTETIK